MSKNERWGIFLLGPLGDTYCMVRAACYVSARALANAELGSVVVDGDQVGWEDAPAEIVGDALVDAFPRILMKTETKPNLVPVEQRGTDGWLFMYLEYGIRRANGGFARFNVETKDRRFWVARDGSFRAYGKHQTDESKDSCGIFDTYDEAHAMLMKIAQGDD